MDSRHLHRSTLAAALALACAAPALAHHGFGLFQMDKNADWSGTLTKLELVNPHSYLYFDTVGADGKPLSIRCEMRAATLIMRSGWKTDQFQPGKHVEVHGHPHRDDPHSCYLESVTVGGAPAIDRNAQFQTSTPVDTSKRPLKLASGEPNISGDWAVEQAVLTIPPSGGNGSLVPRSLREDFAAGKITLDEIRARNPAPARPQYTPEGDAAAKAFRMWSPEDNPRLSCKPTSIVFDWTFDWPVNRIAQTTVNGEKVVDIDYGLYSFSRRIHMTDKHPANLAPSNAGHSIGHWEGDTLVVDTVGFTAGVLVPPTRNSDKLHVVERFTLDPKTFALKREYTAEDPVYLAAPYKGSDVVLLSETPFEKHPCEELTYEFSKGGN
ncbi:MAG TPA: DUF6152 family protein [Gammaproteobacteria bacterium]|nr:DUF6152 family protein [Gammaproteobacteria bacterium]